MTDELPMYLMNRVNMKRFGVLIALIVVQLGFGGVVTTSESAEAGFAPTQAPEIVAEEVIIETEPWNNGAGPSWDYGSRNITRVGDTVFVSVSTPDPNSKPYHNVYWNLYRRINGGSWEKVADAGVEREREPCPIVAMPDSMGTKRIVLSTTPAVGVSGIHQDGAIETTHNEPRLLVFDANEPSSPPDTLMPAWDRSLGASEHSYRGFATDGKTGALIVTQQVRDETFQTWSQAFAYRGPSGGWDAHGILRFPMRGCYPAIAVQDRAVHVVAISDETEPNAAWREYKREVTGKYWDYDFRQLFYTWTPDVTKREFSPPITVASADETAGIIRHTDIYVDDSGAAYAVYTERNVWHDFMRDRFFPGTPIHIALKVAKLEKGRVTDRMTIMETVERTGDNGEEVTFDGPVPTWAVFHGTPDGRLFLIWHQSGDGDDAGMYIQRIGPDKDAEPVRIAVAHPLHQFFNAAERAGAAPSYTVDLVGHPADGTETLRYAQLRINDKLEQE